MKAEEVFRYELEREVRWIDGGGAGGIDQDDFGGHRLIGGAGGDGAFGDQYFLALRVNAQVDNLVTGVRGRTLVSKH